MDTPNSTSPEELPWSLLTAEEVDQRLEKLMDEASDTHGLVQDVLHEHRDLLRAIRDARKEIKEEADIAHIVEKNIHHLEERLDELNHILGRMVQQATENTTNSSE
jgi:peptidoglycan hydrolase CwlO-like protein